MFLRNGLIRLEYSWLGEGVAVAKPDVGCAFPSVKGDAFFGGDLLKSGP